MTNKEKILAAVAFAIKAIETPYSIALESAGFMTGDQEVRAEANSKAIQALKDIPHLLAGAEADAYLAASMEAL